MAQLLGSVRIEVLRDDALRPIQRPRPLLDEAAVAEAVVVIRVKEQLVVARPLTHTAVLGAHVPGGLALEFAAIEDAIDAVLLVREVEGLRIKLSVVEGRVAAITLPVEPVRLQGLLTLQLLDVESPRLLQPVELTILVDGGLRG